MTRTTMSHSRPGSSRNPTMSMLRIGLVCVFAVLLAGSASAQYAGPVSLDLSSTILMPGEIGEAIVSGVASCPAVISTETTM